MKIYKNHYVYLIINIYDYFPRKYYGSRSTNLLPVDDIGHIYFSTSLDKDFILEQKQFPERFEYYVIDNFDTREEALQLEIKLHVMYNVKINESYYNRCNATSIGFDRTGTTNSKEHIQKMKGRKTYINSSKQIIMCFSNDSRLKTGEWKLGGRKQSIESIKKLKEKTSGVISYINIDANVEIRCKKNDPRLKTGDWRRGRKTHSKKSFIKTKNKLKNRKCYINDKGKIIRCYNNDLRLKTGDWKLGGGGSKKGRKRGFKWFHNLKGKAIMCKENDPRLKTGDWRRGMK